MSAGGITVTCGSVAAIPGHAEALGRFAASRSLAYTDFASLALLQPDEPKVWAAWADDHIAAAAIDDGLAMSVGGDLDALRALAARVDDVDGKLVIAGRLDEVRAFMADAGEGRRERPEHFMVVTPQTLAVEHEPVPLRVATRDDLELLREVRARALEEEYGIEVPRDGALYGELSAAVARAVDMQGVAIWVEDDRVAFTAQLIAKTDEAAMFGDLYVDPQLRGAGRATRALTHFCVWLMSESRHVALRVGTTNAPAVRLYERVGFEVRDAFVSSLRADGTTG